MRKIEAAFVTETINALMGHAFTLRDPKASQRVGETQLTDLVTALLGHAVL